MPARNGRNTINGSVGDLPSGGMMMIRQRESKNPKNPKSDNDASSSLNPDHGKETSHLEISGGRVAEPHAFPWYSYYGLFGFITILYVLHNSIWTAPYLDIFSYSFRKKDGPTSACGLWRSPYHQQAHCHRHALCYEILQEDRLQKKWGMLN